MKFDSPGGAGRGDYLARNPTPIHLAYRNNNLASHAETQRFIYTVPAGRVFLLGGAFCGLVRPAAPGAGGYVRADIRADIDGTQRMLVGCDITSTNVVRNNIAVVGQGGMFAAGDILTGYTADATTAGAHGYDLALWGTEFDA